MTFLATTAADKYWDKNAKHGVFLGEWCKLFTKRNVYEQLQYETLRYIWKDAHEIDLAIKYCEDTYENILNKLIVVLNEYHNINKSHQYWNTLLKPWLFPYIQIMYDKYCHLKLAVDEYEDIYTFTIDENEYKYIATPEIFLQNVVNSDEYNLQLYSQIIKYLNIKAKNICTDFTINQIRLQSSKKERILRTLSKLLNYCFNSKRVLIVEPYFKGSTLNKIIKLTLKSKFLFVFDNFKYEIPLDGPIDILRRKEKFYCNLANIEFEDLIINTLQYNLPSIYFENYKVFSNKVKSLKIKLPNILYSANALHNNEIFKFYLSENINKLKFTYAQHGGGIGLDRVNTVEFIERSLAEIYFTFGWMEKDTEILELPLILSKNKNKNKNKKKINFIMTTMPRYFYRFTYLADGTKMVDYIENSKKFLSNINNINNLVIRPYFQDYKWDIKNRLLEINKHLEFDNETNYYEQIQNGRINIFDHMHTGYLESLSMNIPTIIVIPKGIYCFRDNAKPYIEKLKEANILFDDPIQAAKFVDEVYNDIETWWLNERVQNARESFCFQYSRTAKNWPDKWIVIFKKIISNTTNSCR